MEGGWRENGGNKHKHKTEAPPTESSRVEDDPIEILKNPSK